MSEGNVTMGKSTSDSRFEALAEAFIEECRFRLLRESLPRLQKVVPMLSSDELWHRANPQTNSVANLLLHLRGNLEQWILSGLGGAVDKRVRAQEFAETNPIPGEQLLAGLESTLRDIDRLLEELPPELLLSTRRIQGQQITGVGALVHVVEHFSYHVGQITHIVKATKGVDVDYYQGLDLNRRNDSPPS